MPRSKIVRSSNIVLPMEGGKRRGKKMKGYGFFSDLWDGVKSVGRVVAAPVNDILKSTRAISNLAPMVPFLGNTVGRVAGSLGYGKRKKGGSKKAPAAKMSRGKQKGRR